MKFLNSFLAISFFALFLISCSDDDDEEVVLPTEDISIQLEMGNKINLKPETTDLSSDDILFEWTINGEVVSTIDNFLFRADKVGTFQINFSGKTSHKEMHKSYEIVVYRLRDISDKSSAYLASIIEYKPAPGQFINKGFGLMVDALDMTGKPEANLCTLGGFGGFISAGFDHSVLNREGSDLVVYGNAFAGSSEPGIVMVSFDYNDNGKADDQWYELAGSEYNAEKTIHNYEITYTNPHGYKDVPWTDNQGNSGFVKINEYHLQPYFPEFLDVETLTFKGTLLETKTDLNYSHPNYGTIVYNPAREWGYVDNYSIEYSALKGNEFDFDWAVDNEGNKVELPGVDFIKIYTATNTDGGCLGENSTEIMGVADLSMLE